MNCYYKTLGISVQSSQDEIKSAFRLLALRWHPDKNPGDPRADARFKEVMEAYETLSDPSRRSVYDKLKGHRKAKNYSNRCTYEHESNGAGSSYREILEEAFGFQSVKIRERAGSDLRFDLQVSRSAADKGTHEWIDYSRVVFCRKCMGNGRRRPVPSCDRCRGEGEIEEACSRRVWVPAGSKQGSRLRISGGGDHPSLTSRPGDLVIYLHIIDVDRSIEDGWWEDEMVYREARDG